MSGWAPALSKHQRFSKRPSARHEGRLVYCKLNSNLLVVEKSRELDSGALFPEDRHMKLFCANKVTTH